MDREVNVEENAASGSVGEKRSAENGVLPGAKRPRCGDMKRVAEIVLVLSAMGRIRVGVKSPTEAEVRLMAEAREILAEMCAEVAPQDIVGRDAVGALIEDLGLNGKSKEQRLGFRASRLTISEKLSLSQKKMEDPKKIHEPSPTYTSQSLQPSLGGSSQSLRGLPSERPSHAAVSSGGFSVSSAPAHVSAAASTPLPHQLPTYTVTSLPGGQLGKHSSSFSVPRGDRLQVKVEGGSNQQFMSPAWSMQPQSAAMTRSGQESKVLNPGIIRAEGAADFNMRMAPQAAGDQSSRPFVSQPAPGTFPSVPQPVQAPPYINNHNEIAKIVQKLLQPKLPENPTWTPPSREYMNKPMTCQMCKVNINEVETVLLCDACEKGYHLKCLQPASQKSIPRGEWHCMKCLSLSNGKPLPPKYGRVMRSIAPQKGPFNTSAPQSITAEGEPSSENKNGIMDQKVCLSFSTTVAQSTTAEADQSSVKKSENPDQNPSQHPNGTPAVSTPAMAQLSPAENNWSIDTFVQFSTSEAPYLEKKVENPDQKTGQPSGTSAILSTTSVRKVENPGQNAGQPTDTVPAHFSVAEAEPSSGKEVENPYQNVSQQTVTENENSGIQVSSALCSVTSNPVSASDSKDPLALSGKESEVFTGAFPNKEEKSLSAGCGLSSVLSSEKEVENPDEGVGQQVVTENENSSLQVLSVSSTLSGHPGSAPDANVLFSRAEEPEFPNRSEKPPGAGFGSPSIVTSSEKETENPVPEVNPLGATENQSSGSHIPSAPSVLGIVCSNSISAPDSEDPLSLTEKGPGVSIAPCENESGKLLDAGCDSQSVVSSSERVSEHSEKVELPISEERKELNTEGDPSIALFNRSNGESVLSQTLESFQDAPVGQQNCDEVAPSNCQSAGEELEKAAHSSEDHDSASKQNQQEIGTEIPAGSSEPDIVTTMEDARSSESLHSAEDVPAE